MPDTRPYLAPMPPLADDRWLLRAAWALGGVLFAWKLYVAFTANVIWEEGHFAVSGQYPALGYPDIPAGFPWLAGLITAVFGWHVLPLRMAALIISACAAPAVWFMATPVTSRRNALWAAIFALLLPPVSLNGTIFYPEGALQVLLALMLGCLVRALATDARKWWLLAGLCAAAGLLVHFRFLVPGLAVVVFLLASPQGRRQWTKPGVWITAGTGLLGFLPALVYNAGHGWPAIAFHVLNRPSFTLDPRHIVDFLVTQLSLATPVFFIALVAAARTALIGERDRPAGLLGYVGAVTFLFYGVQAIVNKTIMPHWPFMAYVPLLPWLPGIFIAFAGRARSEAGRWARACLIGLGPLFAFGLGLACTVYEYDYAHSAALPPLERQVNLLKNEDWTRLEPDLLAADARAGTRFGPDVAWAASGHISAVRIEFPANPGRRVYTLDEPYDTTARFIVARRDWRLDRAALARDRAGKGVVLALNAPTYILDQPDFVAMYAGLCRSFDGIEPFRTVTLMPGRTAVELYTARVRAEPAPATGAPCPLLPALFIARPTRGAFIARDTKSRYFGMAADPKGIARVDILLDHRIVTVADYGADFGPGPGETATPDVLRYDADWPDLHFSFRFPPGSLTPGQHALSLLATRKDGTRIESESRVLYVK